MSRAYGNMYPGYRGNLEGGAVKDTPRLCVRAGYLL